VAVVVVGILAVCNIAIRTPDLSAATAADLISRAPEFNRYARLVKVQDITHGKDSMAFESFGSFTFRYANSPADVSPLKAWAEFQYRDGKWHFTQLWYGQHSVTHDTSKD